MSIYYGGRAPLLLTVLWTQFSIAFITLVLRVYTRTRLLPSYGRDDCLMIASVSLFGLQNSFTTAATMNGLGQPANTVHNPSIVFKCVKYATIGQVFYILGTAMSNTSVSIFLLRIVFKRWHKMLLWLCAFTIQGVSIAAICLLFLQCKPMDRVWDPHVPGNCRPIFPILATITSAWSPLLDFILATLPFNILWNLHIRRKDKISVLFSLSLCSIAGICGIVRTIELHRLFEHKARNEDYDAIPMLIWSSTELFVSIVCSCLPFLRPLVILIIRGKPESPSESAKGYSLNEYVKDYPWGVGRSISKMYVRDLAELYDMDDGDDMEQRIYMGDTARIRTMVGVEVRGDGESEQSFFRGDEEARPCGIIKVKEEITVVFERSV